MKEKKTLRQKKLFSSREFILTDKELHVKTWDLNDKKEYSIKLETIGNQISYHSNTMITKNIMVGLFAIIPLAIVLSYFFAENPMEGGMVILNLVIWIPLIVVIALIPGKSDIIISGGASDVTLYDNIPSKEEVDTFVKSIIDSSNKFIYEKYSKVDPDLPEDSQMYILNWLLNREIITEKEYEQLKEEYRTKKLI